MDILYKLPFPDEVCSKIFILTCKTPHTGLAIEVLKTKLNMYHLNLPDKDEDVTCIDKDQLIDYTSRDAIDIYFYTLFKNLTSIDLSHTDVTGDIIHLKSLPNLTEIHLVSTHVTGDIIHLKSLPNLTEIHLGYTGVYGDIENLKSLLKLTAIDLSDTGVYGDIAHLKSLMNLTDIMINDSLIAGDITDIKSLINLTAIFISDTEITVNEDLFNEYRESAGLNPCYIEI
jgi:hypothetical protein